MAHNEQSAGSGCALGLDWNATNTDGGTYKLAPTLWRYDSSSTDNYGSSWSEKLYYEPSGSTGSWSGSWGSGSGWRQFDSFSTRTYTKKHSTYTVKITINTDSEFGTYNGGWITLGSKSFSWSTTIPARTSYTVSFNANGGSGAPTSQTKWYAESLTLASTKPTYSGYTFKRWNTNTSDTGTAYSSGASYTGNAALALYAIWNRTVTYNANTNDTVTNLPSAQTAVKSSALTLASTVPRRTGFDFTGWNTAANGSGASYAAGSSYPANNPNVTLYAQWRSAASITSLTAVRCSDNQGTQSDTGTYANIACVWENPNSDATISGTIKPVGGTATALTFTTTSSGTVYTSTATIGDEPTTSGAIDTDTQYTVTASLSVGGAVVASKTIILTKSAFVMDFKQGGTGIGIGTTAPTSGLEIAWSTVLTNGAVLRAKLDNTDASGTPTDGNSHSTDIGGIVDPNGLYLAYVSGGQNAEGRAYTRLAARHTNSGTTLTNYIDVRVMADGSFGYGIADAKEFLNALNVGTLETKDVSTAAAVSTSAYKSIGSVTLAAGTWVIAHGAYFAANNTGTRYVALTTSADAAAGNEYHRKTAMSSPAVATSSWTTALRGATILTYTSSTTLYLTVWQNSGSSINTYGFVRAIRIG